MLQKSFMVQILQNLELNFLVEQILHDLRQCHYQNSKRHSNYKLIGYKFLFCFVCICFVHFCQKLKRVLQKKNQQKIQISLSFLWVLNDTDSSEFYWIVRKMYINKNYWLGFHSSSQNKDGYFRNNKFIFYWDMIGNKVEFMC